MCDVDSGEYVLTLDDRIIRSRRETQCCACCAVIPKGQPHRMWKQHYEHKFKIDRRCLRCDAIASAMAKRGCQVYFDISTGYYGEPAEWYADDLVPDTDPACELVFATQEELEARLASKTSVSP